MVEYLVEYYGYIHGAMVHTWLKNHRIPLSQHVCIDATIVATIFCDGMVRKHMPAEMKNDNSSDHGDATNDHHAIMGEGVKAIGLSRGPQADHNLTNAKV